MRRIVIFLLVAAGLVSGYAKGNNALVSTVAVKSAKAALAEKEQLAITQPQPKPRNKGFKRMRNKIFTVNVFNYNKKIRQKRDKQLKSSKNVKSPKAHKSKGSKHLLLRGNDGNHGFKNKRRW